MLDCFKTRCAKCPGKRRIVPGGGPVPSRVLLVGEAPGRDEDRTGVAFTGRAGDELNNDYLLRAGVPRPDCYVTNAVLCRPDDNKKPDDWIPGLANSCAMHHLVAEIEAVKPEIIVLMGATACELVQGAKIDLELDHGIVQENVLFGKKRRVFPTYHPALGLHDSRAIKFVREDFEALGKELEKKGSTAPKNPYSEPDYGVLDLRSNKDWMFIEGRLQKGFPIAVDTETDGADDEDTSANPYSIQISVQSGWGRWIYATEIEALSWLQETVETYKPRVVFQNAPFDLPVSLKMGVDFSRFEWDDTMFRAFHLGMRHGLKTLGWRLCGVRMKTFEELVRPKWEIAAWEYLEAARVFAELGFEDPEPEMVEIKTGKRKGKIQVRKPMTHFTRLNRIFLDRERKNGGEVLPGKRWEKLPGKLRAEIEEEMGEKMPPFSIRYADPEEAVWYGCQDADVTLRVDEALRSGEAGKEDREAMRRVTRFDTDGYEDLGGLVA